MTRVVVLAATAALLVGCSSSTPEPPGLTASPIASPTSTPDPDAAEIAAVRVTVDAYRAAVLASENTPDPDAAPFFGIASDDVTGAQVSRVVAFVQNGMRRVGAPDLGEPTIAVTGATARLEVCMNQDGWTAVTTEGVPIVAADGTSSSDGPLPSALDLTKVDAQWQVTRVVPVVEATITC